MKVKADFVPESIEYLTQEKVYETRMEGGILIIIVDDDGDEIVIQLKGCAHLEGKPWTIVEE